MFQRVHSYCFGSISLFVLFLLLLPASVSAQNNGRATLTTPITAAFPIIETFLDVHDAQGKFVHGLSTTDIQMLEDDILVPVSQLKEMRPGAQIVVAINPGPPFAIRNSQAISRYDFIVETLINWSRSRQASTLDDMSLLTTDGPEITHVTNSLEWLSALSLDQIDARTATPNLDTLFRAVSLAADPAPRSGMERVVLFITPPPEDKYGDALGNIAAQATEQEVSIFVWIVSSAETTSTPATEQLMALAEQTGGNYFSYTGAEPLPDPEIYFEPLRNIYHLTYNSKIKNAGVHQLAAQVQTDLGQINTPAQTFEIDIQAPQPAFVTPPLQIQRSPSTEGSMLEQSEFSTVEYTPTEQYLQIVIDFPDSRIRPIVRTTLYADGAIAAENNKPPFENFVWKIEKYTSTNQHILKVEVEDVLGLVGSTIDTPVDIFVEPPASNSMVIFNQNIPMLSAVVAVLAVSLLLLVLVLAGRIHPRLPGMGRVRRHKETNQVVPVVSIKDLPAPSRKSSWANRLKWPQRHLPPQAHAFLSPISKSNENTGEPPIPIIEDEVTLGSDPKQATFALDEPSVAATHARLIRYNEHNYQLFDQGTIAGTWINYTPISQEGAPLEHGDLVHIGRAGFRFKIRHPIRVRKPVIIFKDQSQELEEEPQP
jgi:hypothetical protein